jgi:hypothetical protein
MPRPVRQAGFATAIAKSELNYMQSSRSRLSLGDLGSSVPSVLGY